MAATDDEEDDDGTWSGGPVELPIDGTLDLHTFLPAEIGELLPDYLQACRERGILEVRVVHGKGRGALRRTVEAIVRRLPWVRGHRLAGENWGATVVTLAPIEPPH